LDTFWLHPRWIIFKDVLFEVKIFFKIQY
jgi:hypothetical protein